ncbi:tellurite resistance protein TerY [Streptomyces sp. SID3343]|uniref:vWA domain-containing protein n=1 Tax=Streptomyces sp. SID3343 TaxID=2690260 RepID=UPI00136A53A0|nr:tellurite resistance protein TerY [Streptomyces sp. SID3343]MYW04970.1 tellurite resistance protein TerY [Streptomyces sp. SID3343]
MIDDERPDLASGQVPRPRSLPVLVLADVSGSMVQDHKIATLNRAIETMVRTLRTFAAAESGHGDILLAVITFGAAGAVLHQAPVPVSEIRWTDMSAGGRTPLGAALDLVRTVLEDSETIPGRGLHPTLVLVSDGIPTDDWQPAIKRLLASTRGAEAVRLAVAVGAEAGNPSYRVLEAFVADPAIPVVRADEVDRLCDFFRWVTLGVTDRIRGGPSSELPTFDPDALYDLTD